MPTTKPERSDARTARISRRGLLRWSAAGGTAIAVGVSVDNGPVQESEAIAPAVLAAGAIGVSAAVGWALREFEVIGKDDPPEGLTPGAIQEQVYQTLRARKSTNASTFVDNRNIIDGVEHSAYAEGKIEAVSALNDEKQKSDVIDAAHGAVDSYESTVVGNLLSTWNEAVRELHTNIQSLRDHSDASVSAVISPATDGEEQLGSIEQRTVQYELANGETRDIEGIHLNYQYDDYDDTWFIDSIGEDEGILYHTPGKIEVNYGGNSFTYLEYDTWDGIHSDITQTFTDVRDGLSLWVDKVYSEVQAGTLDPDDLLTPRELAEMSPGSEGFNQAVADLAALNISASMERDAVVHFPDLNASLEGSLMYTGSGTLSTGTYQPSEEDEDYYFTYDISEASGTWQDYETAIDGGVLTFTDEPWPDLTYTVETVDGESVTVKQGDFTESSGTWTADLSGSLDSPITSVAEVTYTSDVSGTQYETVVLTGPFEIVTFKTRDGEEKDNAEYDGSEPHNDENYITKEEWEKQQKRYEELIEDYEDAKAASGFNFDQFGFAGLSGEQVVMIGGAILAFLGISN